MSSFAQLEAEIGQTMSADRHRFRQQIRALRKGRPADQPPDAKFEARLARLAEEIRKSAALREARRRAVPQIRFDDELPVSARREEIARAIQEHQVVIVCGETGSGKSTQLPKICLEMGRGIDGLIGHTQPRRIAARSVAARVAEELGSPLGRDAGFKVRFAESLGPRSYIKLMTDGILLAETQSDTHLEQYDTIILDEAHERSLNIDFLIGYIKRLLPHRPGLKLIITSATIDAARFAEHFATAAGPAPVIEVSGRTYPVEVRWRPLVPDEDGDEPDLEEAVLSAVDEVAQRDRGDILIFMPTERDIHETAKALRGRPMPGDATGRETEILPLYARLSIQEQQRVFQPGPKRRIVIATNVAESSLTVPRIHYVIDPGTARISRYSPRTRTQRLPIEPVSRASADQRMGRCGRIAPGVCVRLFGEEDYLARDPYTAPEIQRTNLAAVILQTKALRLGAIENFPFLEPPRPEAIRDGYKTLFELGALDENQELTEIGRQLSRLPLDPRIGRMILAAAEEDCLNEVLIIASALSVQDPRERPLEKQEAADQCHVRHLDPQSDFLSYLKLWDFYHQVKSKVSRNQLRKACRQNFLSFNRMREWLDVHHELLELVQEARLRPSGRERRPQIALTENRRRSTAGRQNRTDEHEKYDAIHRAILTGLLSSLAYRTSLHEYTVAGGGKANVWPGSGIFQGKPLWIVAAEVIETTRRYLRTCGRIDPRWIESIAAHLIKRTYSDPHWDGASASAMATEQVTLFGLAIVAGRRVRFGPIDPATARELMIQHGLVEGDLETKPDFLTHNEALREEMEQLEAKLRRRDLLRGEGALYEFYDARLPADVYDGARLAKWLRENQRQDPRLLYMEKADLVRREAADVPEDAFPDTLAAGPIELPLDYQFAPGEVEDGVTLSVPLDALNQLDPNRLDWLVPGLLEEKVLALIRSLPKQLRTRFVPAPETARQVLAMVRFGEGSIRAAVAAALSRIGGVKVRANDFHEDKLPEELRMNVRVTDAAGNTLVASRDLEAIRKQLGAQAAVAFSAAHDPQWNRGGLTTWDFELPAEVDVSRNVFAMKAHPMLVDRETSVSLRLADSPQRAAAETHLGLRRLFFLAAQRELRTQVDWLPGLDEMQLHAATLAGLNLRQQLAELLADRAFWASADDVPRTKDDFERRVAEGRERIPAAVQEVAGLAGPLLEAYHQARLALERAENPRWQYATDDIQEQLARLGGPNFLATTPWEWLRHCPRYFRAVRVRLEALPGAMARDRQSYEEQFLPCWRAYLERAAGHEAAGVFDPELVRYRWMLEEFRVSLFAQKLGTSVPVSGKRLQQQWEKVQCLLDS